MNWNELKTGADVGAVGGMFSGLSDGASLGQMFANTGSINQQTMAREQKLPYELSGLAQDNYKKTMDNDLQSSVQSPEYLSLAGKNAISGQEVVGLENDQKKQVIPYETFDKVRQQTLQKIASTFTDAASRIDAGEYENVFKELYAQARKPEEQEQVKQAYLQYKGNPKEAAAFARKVAEKAEWDRLNTQPEKVFEMYKLTLEHQARMAAAKNSGGSTAQPNWQLQRAQQVASALKQNPTYSKLSNEQLLALAWKQIASEEKTQQIGDVTLGNNKTSGIEAYPEQGTPAPQGTQAGNPQSAAAAEIAARQAARQQQGAKPPAAQQLSPSVVPQTPKEPVRTKSNPNEVRSEIERLRKNLRLLPNGELKRNTELKIKLLENSLR